MGGGCLAFAARVRPGCTNCPSQPSSSSNKSSSPPVYQLDADSEILTNLWRRRRLFPPVDTSRWRRRWAAAFAAAAAATIAAELPGFCGVGSMRWMSAYHLSLIHI